MHNKEVRTRTIAVIELLLLFPAALFMGALALRNLAPPHSDLARIAQQLVMWYAHRIWTLWILLFALPLLVLISGGAETLRNWNRDSALSLASRRSLIIVREHAASLFLAATTLMAAVILTIVVLHVLTN